MSVIDTSMLDLAFLLDCTSSMGTYIDSAKKNIQMIADEIKKSESCHMRVGLVKYRDHPPEDRTFVTQVDDLTDDIFGAKSFIEKACPQGGGDFPESTCCALHDCLNKLSWRNNAVKVAVLVCDAPPHGIGAPGDRFARGCPLNNDPVDIVHQMAAKGITLYCAGCEPSLTPYRQFFVALTLITGGQYVPLNSADHLAKVIVGGSREEISTEKLMAQVHEEVIKEAAAKGTKVDEDELTRRIHSILNSQGSKVNKIEGLPEVEVSDQVKEMSKEKTLASMLNYAQINNVKIHSYSILGSFAVAPTPAPTFAPVSLFAPRRKSDIMPKKRPVFPKKTAATKKRATTAKRPIKRLALTFTQTRYNLRSRTKIVGSYTVFYRLRPTTKTARATTRVAPAVRAAAPVAFPTATPVATPAVESISMIQTRRMVKKALARNKLN